MKEYQTQKKALQMDPNGGVNKQADTLDVQSEEMHEEEITFDEIFEGLIDGNKDKESAKVFLEVQELEARNKELDENLVSLPQFDNLVTEYTRTIIDRILERREELKFMTEMLEKFSKSGKGVLETKEMEVGEDIQGMLEFYDGFAPKIAKITFEDMIIPERFGVQDYFDSALRSNFNKPKQAPVEFVHNESSHFSFDNHEDSLKEYRNPKALKEPNSKEANNSEDEKQSSSRLNHQRLSKEAESPGRKSKEIESPGRRPRQESASKSLDKPRKDSVDSHEDNRPRRIPKMREKKRLTREVSKEPKKDSNSNRDEDDYEGDFVSSKKKGGNTDLKKSIRGSSTRKRDSIDSFEANENMVEFESTEQYNQYMKNVGDLVGINTKSESPESLRPRNVEKESIGERRRRVSPERSLSKELKKTCIEELGTQNQKMNQKKGSETLKNESEENLINKLNVDEGDNWENYKRKRSESVSRSKPQRIEEEEEPVQEMAPRKVPVTGKKLVRSSLVNVGEVIQIKQAEEAKLPPWLKGVDVSRYENQIYTTKKRKMYIAIKDFRVSDKNYFPLRQGDVVCCVSTEKGWYFVYKEENPKKFGFCPGNYLNLIS